MMADVHGSEVIRDELSPFKRFERLAKKVVGVSKIELDATLQKNEKTGQKRAQKEPCE